MAERPKGYGMTAELQDKKAAKYDSNLDQQVREWLEEIVGEPFPASGEPTSDSFHEALKDGQYLCKFAVALGEVIKYNQSKMAFKQMENINFFLGYCEKCGVPKNDLFQTVDLYEGQNIPQVINGIVALSRRLSVIKGDDFPSIGPKESTGNKRVFTEQQLKEGQNVIGLQMGSNTGASQAGMTAYGQTRQILRQQ